MESSLGGGLICYYLDNLFICIDVFHLALQYSLIGWGWLQLWTWFVFRRWLYHHYCAMGMALVSLTWEIKGQPNCVQKQVLFTSYFLLCKLKVNLRIEFNHLQRGVHLFLQWAMMQGVAMLLQNRYQRQRLYTRIALGKVSYNCTFPQVQNFIRFWKIALMFSVENVFQAKRMDVVWGETAGVDGQLWLLCPILFILQVSVLLYLYLSSLCYNILMLLISSAVCNHSRWFL